MEVGCRLKVLWTGIGISSLMPTYTVIRRLEERGVVKNENATVTSLVSKEDAQKSRLDEMMEDTFEGSMPAFLAAFSRTKRLTKSEVKQLQDFIDSYQEEGEL